MLRKTAQTQAISCPEEGRCGWQKTPGFKENRLRHQKRCGKTLILGRVMNFVAEWTDEKRSALFWTPCGPQTSTGARDHGPGSVRACRPKVKSLVEGVPCETGQ